MQKRVALSFNRTVMGLGQLVLVVVVSASAVSTLNERPVIGVMTEKVHNSSKFSMAASYVKFLECAGARVVPIFGNVTEEQLTAIFNAVNGVLFPGGGVDFSDSDYSRVGSAIYTMAKKANDQGDYFPLWGTCLGFEFLGYLEAGHDHSVLAYVDAENLPLPVKFTNEAKSSRMFSELTEEQASWLSTENITFNNHQFAISVKTFNSRPDLNQFYTSLATSVDRNGIEFVAAMEGKKYPFCGVQWHPEKNGFEWNLRESISHSEHAITVMQLLANFFVSEARHSTHTLSTSMTSDYLNLIYAYTPTYTGHHSDFEETYYF